MGSRHTRDFDQRTSRPKSGIVPYPDTGRGIASLDSNVSPLAPSLSADSHHDVGDLQREKGNRHNDTPKHGPALDCYGVLTTKNALCNTMSALPTQLQRSLTWDGHKEMSAYAQFKVETGIPVLFADPNSPWQRGTKENTHGFLH